MKEKRPVLVIAGPTAGGKSARALALARERGGVIINADSLQLYGALPLLTAQPPAADQAAVPHRLYGILTPKERCSAAQWRERAVKEIDAAHEAGQVPILTGGTGFYLKALLQGLSPLPDVPASVRAEAATVQEKLGNPGFHAELAKRDAVMAARLHPNDTQRLVRAWEIFAHTGKSLAYWQELPVEPPPAHYAFEIELIVPERDELYRRCNARFDAMMAGGAVDEAAALIEKIRAGSVEADAPVTHALGFRELRAALAHEISMEEAITLAKASTRHYAKRQVTWFRHQL